MDKETIKNEIITKLKLTKAPPILFVGSGLSRRYLNTPSWDGLLKMFTNIINDDSLAYEMYYSDARSMNTPFGINPKIAELIEKDFNKKWYRDDKFSESRKKNSSLAKKKCSPLKIEIAEYFKAKSYGSYAEGMDEEINLLCKVGNRSIGGIITTNYDCLIERILSNYKYDKFIGQEELIFSSITGMSEIYKIHGCCTNPNSIIINEKDYEIFNEKNAYLIAKLLTIFMEHPIIFLGYSISDLNIIDILINISKCLSTEKLVKLKDRFIFIQWNDTTEEDTITPYELSVGNGKSIFMTKAIIKDYSFVYEALLENKVSYNPRLIKKLKNDIYKLVVTSEPLETLKVLVDVDDDRLNEVEAVVGFGVMTKLGIRGYGTFSAEDLFEDLIYDKNLNSKLIVAESLPTILKSTRIVPLFKYLKQYDGTLPPIVKKWSESTMLSTIFTRKIRTNRTFSNCIINRKIADIRAEKGLDYTFAQIFYVNEKYYNSIDLYDIINEYMTKYPDCLRGNDEFKKNDLKRAIRLYDYIKYKNEK